MKKMTIIILALFCFASIAMDANQLKQKALDACEVEVTAVSEDVREKTKKLCECKVDNTDYAIVLEAQQTGDTEKVKKEALAVAAICANQQD